MTGDFDVSNLAEMKNDQETLKRLQFEVLKGIQAGKRGEHVTQTLDEIAIEEQAEYSANIG